MLFTECPLTVTCSSTGGNGRDFCIPSTGITRISYVHDALLGTHRYEFESSDHIGIGNQTVTITTTANQASSSATFSFTLNLIDPCEQQSIVINPSITPATLYKIYTGNSAQVETLTGMAGSSSHFYYTPHTTNQQCQVPVMLALLT